MKTNQKLSYRLLAGGLLGVAASVLSTPVMAQPATATPSPAPAPSDVKPSNAAADASATATKSAPAPLPTIDAAPGSPEEIAQLRELVTALTSRLQTLEADQKKTADTVTKNAPSVTAREKLVISGLAQVHGLGFFGQDGDAPRASDTFRLRRGELRITGNITPRISGTVMIDPAKTLFNRAAAFGDTANNTIRSRDNILQEIQISYLLRKAAQGSNDNIYLDIGQYKIPVGYESLMSSGGTPFVDRSLMFTQRDPFDGGYGDVRDTGVQLRGTQGQFEYRIGVFNGFGDRQNTLAISDAKAILARLAYNPKSIPGLQIGVSGGRGNTGNRNSGSLLSGPRSDRNLLNAFAAYKKDKFSFQAEYLEGESVGFTDLIGTTTERDLRGYYAGIGYYFTPKIEGVLRYDYLDANRNASGDTSVRDLLAGINYYIKGNNAKIQFNIINRNGASELAASSNPSTDIVNDRTEIRTNFQIAF